MTTRTHPNTADPRVRPAGDGFHVNAGTGYLVQPHPLLGWAIFTADGHGPVQAPGGTHALAYQTPAQAIAALLHPGAEQ